MRFCEILARLSFSFLENFFSVCQSTSLVLVPLYNVAASSLQFPCCLIISLGEKLSLSNVTVGPWHR